MRYGAKKPVEMFIKVLEGEDQSMHGVLVRCSAADYLGRSGDKRAVEPLIKALHYKNPSLREWAAISLGRIKDDRAVEPLVEALKDRILSVFVRQPCSLLLMPSIPKAMEQPGH